jgi:hypothetical protein
MNQAVIYVYISWCVSLATIQLFLLVDSHLSEASLVFQWCLLLQKSRMYLVVSKLKFIIVSA